MNLEGKIIGNRYEILEKIGNGGMATVYRARCQLLNRFVAVKVLKDEFITDEEFIKRFNTEAQSAASLSHPNIVSIYDVGQEGNLYYIVMELVKGKTLKEIINEEGTLPWKWSVNIAGQIASALEMAHKNRIVHRDIKPHNIIITEEGVAKVTDFGIAKAVSNSTITAFGTTIGSVHYFSPEHARGGYTDAKSDLYSLGVVMYEMVTGRVPFDADTAVSVALKHMQEKPVEPIKLNPTIPMALNQIIMKAMQKETNLRYQSATEILRDLNALLKNPDEVMVENKEENDYTRVIPTIHEDMLEKDTPATDGKKGKKKNKVAAFFEKHPKLKILSIGIGLILVFIIALLITYFSLEAGRPNEVELPNLVNMTKEEAVKKLEELKVECKIKSEEFNKDVEAGKIISQDPPFAEGYMILEGSTVELVVSKGTEEVDMPKLTGLTWDEAEEKLNEFGLKGDKVEEISTKVEAGVVIKQEVKEGEKIEKGSIVKVYVSKGDGIVRKKMISVLTLSREEAEKKLNEMNFKVNVEYGEDTSKNNDVVLKQSVDSGVEVEEGSTITITVNKLPEEKNGTINVNVKSILNYTTEKDENGNVKEPEKVKVEIKVGEDTIYSEKHRKDTTNISQSFKGVGTVRVRVYIDGVLKGDYRMNLNNETVYTFE